MKPTKSAGHDNINMKIIKDYYSVLEEPLHHFVTRVIETQDYPQAIKVSRVVPLLKAPDLNTKDCKSNRLVNILPSLSKVMEKLFSHKYKTTLMQMMSYLQIFMGQELDTQLQLP